MGKISKRLILSLFFIFVGIAVFTYIISYMTGAEISFSALRAVAVMVIGFPCAQWLSRIVSVKIANQIAARNGIVFKTAASLMNAGKTQIVALQKNGYITNEEIVVTDILTADFFLGSGYSMIASSEDVLLETAALLEKNNEHPIAKAVIKYTNDLIIDADEELTNYKSYPGEGSEGEINGIRVMGGNYEFITNYVDVPSEVKFRADELSNMGKTPLYYAKGSKLLGVLAVADSINKEASMAIAELKNMGIKVVMLAEGNGITAKAIGKEAGVDEVITISPVETKEQIIDRLSKLGKVAVVGDGIGDEEVLLLADTGIVVTDGRDVKENAADIVLERNSLSDVPSAIRLSRKILTSIYENLYFAFLLNALAIPIVAGIFFRTLGVRLNILFLIIAVIISILVVTVCALRLNNFQVHDASGDKKIKNDVIIE